MTKDPYGQFADMMSSAMRGHTKQMASGLGGVLGTMTSSGVKLDDFKHEFQDYLLAEFSGTMEAASDSGADNTGTSTVRSASQSVSTDTAVSEQPGQPNPTIGGSKVTFSVDGLKPGDRVLAIRVNDGSDIVVLCKVVSAGG